MSRPVQAQKAEEAKKKKDYYIIDEYVEESYRTI
jgi:hypothetical protein